VKAELKKSENYCLLCEAFDCEPNEENFTIKQGYEMPLENHEGFFGRKNRQKKNGELSGINQKIGYYRQPCM
jgi:hypothetical protein